MLSMLAVVLLFILWFGVARRFYKVGDDFYVTVWKAFGKTYVVPGKYYGISKPTVNHIMTANDDLISIFKTSDERENLIILCKGCIINTIDSGNVTFEKYKKDSTGHKWKVYKPDAKTMDDLNVGVDYIFIDVKEGYAMNERDEKL